MLERAKRRELRDQLYAEKLAKEFEDEEDLKRSSKRLRKEVRFEAFVKIASDITFLVFFRS